MPLTSRMRYLVLGLPWFVLLYAFGKEGTGESEFIGAERCKLCHRSVYQSWTATAHRGATELLSPDEVSPDCLRCHATGPESLSGVQCEACHGAGGDYWPPEVMVDPEKARQAGLVEPNESVCRSCHGSGYPEHPAEFSMPSPEDETRVIH